jgi:hypothetical protein
MTLIFTRSLLLESWLRLLVAVIIITIVTATVTAVVMYIAYCDYDHDHDYDRDSLQRPWQWLLTMNMVVTIVMAVVVTPTVRKGEWIIWVKRDDAGLGVGGVIVWWRTSAPYLEWPVMKAKWMNLVIRQEVPPKLYGSSDFSLETGRV